MKNYAILILVVFALLMFPQNVLASKPDIFFDHFHGRHLSAGWIVEYHAGGGSYIIKKSMLTLSANAGPYDSITVYRDFVPQADRFAVAARVKATSLAAFALRIHAAPLPIFGSTVGAQLEFDSEVESKYFSACWPTPSWYWVTIYGPTETGFWYVLEMRVQRSPFAITYNVYDDNPPHKGVLLGTITATNIVGFGYDDIRYICLEVWAGPSLYHVDWVKIT